MSDDDASQPPPTRPALRRVPLVPAIVFSVCLSLIGGAAAAWGIYQHYGPVERVINQVPSAQSGGTGGSAASVGAIATAAAPSVVKVLTQPVTPPDLLAQPKGFAVGFIASGDGLVVTSAHAIQGATQLRVATADGHVYDAVVAGADVAHGIAVLRAVGAANLPALTFASATVRPGDLAVAVGAPPFGSVSVTSGTVSSVGRSLSIPATGAAAYEVLDALTVDGVSDPQADGGPLLDGAGRVMGVVVTVPGDTSLPGVVALSGKDAAALVDRLSHGGTSQRPTFGVTAILLDPATAAAAGLPRGALLRSVSPGGPADKAGLLKGDVVTAVNGVAVDADHPLDPAALGVQAGQTVSLSVTRASVQLQASVTVVDGSG
jgi:S1-C subfamily serine protease